MGIQNTPPQGSHGKTSLSKATIGRKESQMGSRILRLKEVMKKTGLSKATIGRMEKSGDFPPRVKLGARAVGWRSEDFDEWIAELKPVSGGSDSDSAPHSALGGAAT